MTTTAYCYFSFGWLVGMCIEKLTGKNFSSVVRELVSEPLGIQSEMYMGDVVTRQLSVTRIASIENSMYKEAFGGTDQGELAEVENESSDSDTDSVVGNDTNEDSTTDDTNGASRKGKAGGFLGMMAQGAFVY
jgi:CubicO group peptidase (beta-lactamase class C family)